MVGKIIKKYREKAGISQTEIASILGITPQSYGPIEKSNSVASDKLIKIAQVLNVSIDTLLGSSFDKPNGKVLSFVNQKGGVGKTTLTILFATMYASLNPSAKVCIIDTDFQQSVIQKRANEQQNGLESLVDVIPFLAKDTTSPVLNYMQLIEDIKEQYDLIVIDTIGSMTDVELISTIILNSDLVIIPIQPSELSINSSISTISLIKDIKESSFRNKDNFDTKILVSIAKNNLESRALATTNKIYKIDILKEVMKDKTSYIRNVSLAEPIKEENFINIYQELITHL